MPRSANARPDTGNVLERMIDMMSVIPRAPAWISTADVAARLEALGYVVDRRTVVRDLNKLSARFGFERRGDRNGDGKRAAVAYAWRWPTRSVGIGVPTMTEVEALTLAMARQHLDALLPPMVMEALAPQFARAEDRLKHAPSLAGSGLRHWSDSVFVVQPTQPLLKPAVRHAVRDVICIALAARTQFTGWYRSRASMEAKEMRFNPLGLVVRAQVTYLVATTWEYDDVRLFPLHRFERAQKEDSPRREPAGFDLATFLAGQNGLGFATGRGDIELRLRFRNGAGQHLLETPLSEGQVVEERENGVLEVTATMPETAQLAWWLLGFGNSVEVLEPAHLREQMREQARGMCAIYH